MLAGSYRKSLSLHSPDFSPPQRTCRWTLSAAIWMLPAEVNGTQTEKWSLLIAGRISQTQTAISSYASSLLSGGFGTVPRYARCLCRFALAAAPPPPFPSAPRPRSCRDVQQEASSALPFHLTQADVHPQLNGLDADIKGIWFQRVGKRSQSTAACFFSFLNTPVSPLCNWTTSAIFLVHITTAVPQWKLLPCTCCCILEQSKVTFGCHWKLMRPTHTHSLKTWYVDMFCPS